MQHQEATHFFGSVGVLKGHCFFPCHFPNRNHCPTMVWLKIQAPRGWFEKQQGTEVNQSFPQCHSSKETGNHPCLPFNKKKTTLRDPIMDSPLNTYCGHEPLNIVLTASNILQQCRLVTVHAISKQSSPSWTGAWHSIQIFCSPHFYFVHQCSDPPISPLFCLPKL